MLKKVVLSCLLAFITISVFAQKEKPKTANWYEKTGNMYYENKKYLKALPYLLKYQSFKPTDKDTKLKIGLCYLETGRSLKAQEYFDFLLSQKNIDSEVYELMARTMHLSHDFDQAILYYKRYLGTLNDNDPKRFFVKDNIKRCVIGTKIIYKDQLGLVENLGDKINTSSDDFAPVFAPNYDNIIYFSSTRDGNFGGMFDEKGKEDTLKGQYRSDIYVSRLSKGEWTSTVPLDDRYNTVYHDVVNCFSKDGGLVYMSQSKDMYFDYGDVYMNNFFEDDAASKNFKLPEPINSYDWEGDVFFFNNSIMLFSSDRKGGFGGKDIYIAKKDEEGNWSLPSNLGPGVNTPYDEVSPFLAADGRSLFFSSNNLQSMGGYDIFVVKFDEKINNWTKPSNLGMPINSAADESYFKLSEDGLRAFFSSARPDGFGKRDLYVTYFRRMRPEQQTKLDTITFQYAIDAGLLSNKVAPSEVSETPTNTQSDTPTKTELYKFAPLYYAEFGESETLEMNSLLELNKLIKLMKKHTDLNVELNSHIDNNGTEIHFNLFFSLKNAENVADYMIDQGVQSNRIFMKGLGANYPVSKSLEADGTSIVGGKRLNKRVEIKVYRPETASIIVQYSSPSIVDAMAVDANVIHNKILKGISYKVQVKTLSTMLDDNVLSDYTDPTIERTADSEMMKYTVGLVKSHRTAEEIRQELIAKGFTDAYIVAYKDGERLENQVDIKKYAELFPDLKNMLK